MNNNILLVNRVAIGIVYKDLIFPQVLFDGPFILAIVFEILPNES